MKKAVVVPFLSLLLLVGCTVEQAVPTVASATQATTTILPRSTTVLTAKSPITVPVSSPTEPTTTATPLSTATDTPIPTAPLELMGTATAFDPLLLPEGYLLFFWDTETPVEEPAYFSIPVSEPQQDLYVAVPDKSLEDWQISPILSNQLNWPDEYTSWPRTAVSSDQTQLAFTLYKKIDTSSYAVNIHVANFAVGTLTQITKDQNTEIYNISWLPNNQTAVYSLGKGGFLAYVDNIIGEQFTPTFPSNVAKLGNSPDGQFVAIILQTGELFFYNLKSEELLSTSTDSQLNPNTAIWSADSNWFATNLISSTGLMAFNVQTNEHVTLFGLEYFSLLSWSPDIALLAFIKGTRETTDLYIWDPASQETKLIVNLGNYLDTPVWSPQGRYLAVAFADDEMIDLLSIDIKANEIDAITHLEGVKQFEILSWSPDERWILVFLAQKDKSCLYIINRVNGDSYCAVDSTGTVNPFAVYWLPGEPLLP